MPYNRFPGLGQSGLSNHGTRTSFPRSLIDSGNENEVETGKNSKSMVIVRGLLEDYDKGGAPFGSPFRQYQVENDPDIVHVKLLRNNTFITVTDSKGNKKFGASAGTLASGGKVSRFAAESTAEHVGREARNRNLKSVVMKINLKTTEAIAGEELEREVAASKTVMQVPFNTLNSQDKHSL
nr:probable ribosomal protein S11, mitochondrial [Ipomoea batatas]